MEVYKKNLNLWNQRYPYLLKERHWSGLSFKIKGVNGKLGLPTFYIHLSNGKKVLFHSLYDPQKEAQEYVRSKNLEGITSLFMLGMGLGYQLIELKKVFCGLIFVIEPSREIIKLALHKVDLSGLLDEPRIFILHKLCCAKQIVNLYNIQLQLKGLDKVAFLGHPASYIYGRYWNDLLQPQAEILGDFLFMPLASCCQKIISELLAIYHARFKESSYTDNNAFSHIMFITEVYGLNTYNVEVLFEHAFFLFRQKNYPSCLEAFSMAWGKDALKSGCLKYADKKLIKKTAACYKTIARHYRREFSREELPAPRITRTKKKRLNCGHITNQFIDDVHSPTELLKTFVRYHDREHFNLFLYSSEAGCVRKNPQYPIRIITASSQERAPKFLTYLKECGIKSFCAPLDGTHLDSSLALARRISQDNIDIAFFHSSMCSTIDYLIASWRIIPLQINIDMGSFMYSQEMDAVTYFVPSTFKRDRIFWKRNNIPCFLMPSGIDFQERMSNSRVVRRSELGLEPDQIVLITVGSHLGQRISQETLELLSSVLTFEGLVWLIIGPGDFSYQRSFLAEKGLLEKVRFLGSQSNVFSYLRIADIYINEFPQGGGMSVLEAMAVGLPVVAMLAGKEHLQSCGANYVGEEWQVKDPGGYKNLFMRLIKDAHLRRELGCKMKERYEQEFSPSRMVLAFEELALGLYEKKMSRRRNTSSQILITEKFPPSRWNGFEG